MPATLSGSMTAVAAVGLRVVEVTAGGRVVVVDGATVVAGAKVVVVVGAGAAVSSSPEPQATESKAMNARPAHLRGSMAAR
jgi:hypothetical protein